MFEDSLIESQGRIRTKSRWLAIVSLLAQASLLLLLILFPLIHPEALPKQSMRRLLLAPPPPQAPPAQAHAAATSASRSPMPSLEAQLRAPSTIPTTAAQIVDGGPPTVSPIGGLAPGDGTGIPDGINLGAPAPAVTIAKPPAPKHPLIVSSGVATGLLLRPIQPIYPAIAKATRTEGTVVIEATISRLGRIENLRVLEGPTMLRQAAIDAVAAAQYRPFLLNGEPIEVQTSIRVIFSLGG